MRRAVILGLIGVLLLGAALLLQRALQQKDQIADTTPPTSAAPAPPPADSRVTSTAPAPPAAAPAQPVAPSFDVVRVNPRGDAVIAGRAEPRAEVQVLDGERVLGTVTADPRGEWVLLPSAPLPSGERQLSLQAHRPGTAADAPPVLSDQVVVVTVPEPSVAQRPDAAAPVAMLMPRGATAGEGRRLIERGDSLWGLAKRNYGRGTDYDAIYQANRDQIRNPDLIYPGQVFVIPPSR